MSPARAALVELLELERYAPPPPPVPQVELERRIEARRQLSRRRRIAELRGALEWERVQRALDEQRVAEEGVQ